MKAKRTPLYHALLARNAQMAEKAHFLTANAFTDSKSEHHAVRNAAGLFEIFGQFLVEIAGPRAEQFLNETLVADFTKVPVGGGVYCGILNEAGGFIDDVITYRSQADLFWLVPAPAHFALASCSCKIPIICSSRRRRIDPVAGQPSCYG